MVRSRRRPSRFRIWRSEASSKGSHHIYSKSGERRIIYGSGAWEPESQTGTGEPDRARRCNCRVNRGKEFREVIRLPEQQGWVEIGCVAVVTQDVRDAVPAQIEDRQGNNKTIAVRLEDIVRPVLPAFCIDTHDQPVYVRRSRPFKYEIGNLAQAGSASKAKGLT